MSHQRLKILLSISLLLFLFGLFITRFGLVKYTYHISDKSPQQNPFVDSNFENSHDKLWNTKLYKKVVIFLLENQSYEWLSNDSTVQKMVQSSNSNNFQWTLFDDLIKREPQNTVFRKIETHSPYTTLVKIATYMIGTNSAQFEVGIQSKNSFQSAEDNIFYQLNQSKYDAVGYLNENWYKSFPNFLKQNKYLLQSNIEDSDQNLNSYSEILDLIKKGSFDFLFLHDNVQGLEELKVGQNSHVNKIQRIEEQMRKITQSISQDTIFIAMSDRSTQNFGGKNQNLNTCFSDNHCTPFFFSYSKSGFIQDKEYLQEIQKLVKYVNNTIHESQIASTISNIMGLPIPYSNSGRPIFDIYPSKMSNSILVQRILEDSYTTMKQQFQFLSQIQKKYDLLPPIQIREFGQMIDEIRQNILKNRIDKEQIKSLTQKIIQIQENMKEIISNVLFPYNMTLIYIGYTLLIISIVMAISLIIFSNFKQTQEETDDPLKVRADSSTNKDLSFTDNEIGKNKQKKDNKSEEKYLLKQQQQSSSFSSIDFVLNVVILGQNFLYFHDSWSYQLSKQDYTSNQATCIVIISAELFIYFICQFIQKPQIRSLWFPMIICFLIAIIKFLFVNRYIFKSSLPVIPYSEIAYPLIYLLLISIANSISNLQYQSKKLTAILTFVNVFSIIIIIVSDSEHEIISTNVKRFFFILCWGFNQILCYLLKKKCRQTNLYILINQQLSIIQLYVAIFSDSSVTEYLGLIDYLITSNIIITLFGLFQILDKFAVQIYLVFLNTIYAFSSGVTKDSTSEQFSLLKNIFFTFFGMMLFHVQLLQNKEKLTNDNVVNYLTKMANSQYQKYEISKPIKVFGYFSIAIMIQMVFFFTTFLLMANKFFFHQHFQTHSVFCNELLASFTLHVGLMIYFINFYNNQQNQNSNDPDKFYEMVQQNSLNNQVSSP